MRKTILPLGMCLIIILIASNVISAPRLTIPESVFEFGYVPQNSKVSHVFWLHSSGEDSLKILKVIPGWGCTKAPLEKKELAVGDSTKLEIIFSTKRYKNRITKRPKIQTNEGPPDKNVQIIVDVVTRPDSTYPIVIKPYKIDLTQFGEKIRDEVNFKITNVSDQKLKPSMVSISDEYFDVDLPSSISPGKTVEAKLKLKKTSLNKNFEKSFTFQLDDEKNSRFTVPVKRQLRPSIQQSATTPKTKKSGSK